MTILSPEAESGLPDGADPDSDGWQYNDGVVERLVWSTPMPLPENLQSHDIRVVVTQRSDGTLINNHGDDQPLVYYGSEDYLPVDARLIAQALNAAADLAVRWGGGLKTADQVRDTLAPIGAELKAAHLCLFVLSGSADSLDLRRRFAEAGTYVRAAVDSITDAIGALR